jgi:proteasome lid subunit RPN8/RPN11
VLSNPYRYVLMLYREDGSAVDQVAATVDWEPAREWTRFLAVRRGWLTAGAVEEASLVEPVWHPKLSEPFVDGFRVSVAANGAGDVSTGFSISYFRPLVSVATSRLVEEGTLKAGERLAYLAAAYPNQESASDGPARRFTATEIAAAVPLKEGALGPFSRAGAPVGPVAADDMPVFVPERVLSQAAELARDAGAKETGGILVGRLHRDTSLPEVFAEVTAQIHARDAEADLTTLSFTSETWTAVRAALDLRRQDEIMLGWWHSHPVREWCKSCSPEKQRVCRMAADFFSGHDRALHRAVFPRAYSVALVVNDLPDVEPTFSLFGWRQGLLESRGFHRIGGEPREAPAGTAEGAAPGGGDAG